MTEIGLKTNLHNQFHTQIINSNNQKLVKSGFPLLNPKMPIICLANKVTFIQSM